MNKKNWEIKILKPKASGDNLTKGPYAVISLLRFSSITHEEVLEKIEIPMENCRRINGRGVCAKLYTIEKKLFETIG